MIAHVDKEVAYKTDLPDSFFEDDLGLSDYVDLPAKMESGDLVFAWDPLAAKLDADTRMVRVEGPPFETTVSMYLHKDFCGEQEGDYPLLFSSAIVAAWNQCRLRRNSWDAWLSLLRTEEFVSGFMRGVADPQ